MIRLPKALKLGGLLVCYLFFITAWYRNYVADVYSEYAQGVLVEQNLSGSISAIDKAIQLNPLEPNYYRLRARIYVNLLSSQDSNVKDQIKKFIHNDLKKAYELNPKNLVTIRNVIPIYYFLGAQDISLAGSKDNVDPNYVHVVSAFYAQTKMYVPNDVGVYALIYTYEKRLGLDSEYEESLKRVMDLRPDLIEWYDAFRE